MHVTAPLETPSALTVLRPGARWFLFATWFRFLVLVAEAYNKGKCMEFLSWLLFCILESIIWFLNMSIGSKLSELVSGASIFLVFGLFFLCLFREWVGGLRWLFWFIQVREGFSCQRLNTSFTCVLMSGWCGKLFRKGKIDVIGHWEI